MGKNNSCEIERYGVTRRVALTGGVAFGFATIAAPNNELLAQGVHGFRNRVKKYKDQKESTPDSQSGDSWFNSIIPGNPPKENQVATAFPTLLAASSRCLSQGNRCLEYCRKRLNEGERDLIKCQQTVQAMLPVSHALGKLSEVNAVRLADMAKTAIGFLMDCEIECRKFAQVHVPCKDCADACRLSIQECKKLIGA